MANRTYHDGPYPCHFGCGAKLSTKYNGIAIAGWDWFTGSGKRTAHVCPQCRYNRPTDVRLLMKARGITPSDEPDMTPPYPTLMGEFPRIEVAP